MTLAGVAGAIGVRGLIAIGLAAALAFTIWRADGLSGDLADAREDLSLARAEMALLRTQGVLLEAAAAERAADTAAIAEAEKELVDAIHEVPDRHPDAVRVRLGCERLRRAGYLDADLPAVCGPGGGAEAEAAAGDRHQRPGGR